MECCICNEIVHPGCLQVRRFKFHTDTLIYFAIKMTPAWVSLEIIAEFLSSADGWGRATEWGIAKLLGMSKVLQGRWSRERPGKEVIFFLLVVHSILLLSNETNSCLPRGSIFHVAFMTGKVRLVQHLSFSIYLCVLRTICRKCISSSS